VPGLYRCGFLVGSCGVLVVAAVALPPPLMRVLPPLLFLAGALWRPLPDAGAAGGAGGGGGGCVLALVAGRGGGGGGGGNEAPAVLVGDPKLNRVPAACRSVPVTRGGAVVVVGEAVVLRKSRTGSAVLAPGVPAGPAPLPRPLPAGTVFPAVVGRSVAAGGVVFGAIVTVGLLYWRLS
jgi:hypothetical protein